MQKKSWKITLRTHEHIPLFFTTGFLRLCLHNVKPLLEDILHTLPHVCSLLFGLLHTPTLTYLFHTKTAVSGVSILETNIHLLLQAATLGTIKFGSLLLEIMSASNPAED